MFTWHCRQYHPLQKEKKYVSDRLLSLFIRMRINLYANLHANKFIYTVINRQIIEYC